MNNAQGTAFGLIMRMIAHGLRRYWRILWMCFILSGLFCVFFIVFQSSEPPNEIRKESHVAKRQNVFYQSMNEQMAVPQFHPKQLKTEKPTKPVNPAIVPKEQSKHPRSEKRIDSKKKVEFIKPGFKSVPARDHDMTLNKVLDRKSDSFHKKLDNEIPLERRQSLRKKSTQKSIARDIKKPIVGNGIIPKQLSSTLAITQHHTKTTTEVELQKKVNIFNIFISNYHCLHNWIFVDRMNGSQTIMMTIYDRIGRLTYHDNTTRNCCVNGLSQFNGMHPTHLHPAKMEQLLLHQKMNKNLCRSLKTKKITMF